MSRLRGWLIRQRRIWKTRREGLSGAALEDVEDAVRRGVRHAAGPVINEDTTKTGLMPDSSHRIRNWLIRMWRF